MGEDFRLKWNDHHNVFFSTAEQLCNGDHLTDVTLSCGEKEFAAHKLVLSICSSYFSQLFAPRPDRDDTRRRNAETIVYLKDVDARHMELLMNYMYRGEINVEENELMGLLATAKSLQIKGLTESEEDDTKSSNQGSYSEPSAVTPRPTVSKKRPAPKPLSTSAVPTPSTSSGSSLPAKKIKHDIKQEEIQIQPEVVSADPFQAEDDETGPEQAEEYLEADDPNLELESHDYNLDTSQGAESMAYEGDPNNPGVSTHFIVSSTFVHFILLFFFFENFLLDS